MKRRYGLCKMGFRELIIRRKCGAKARSEGRELQGTLAIAAEMSEKTLQIFMPEMT